MKSDKKESRDSYLINIAKDGSIDMHGGLIFFPGGFIYSEFRSCDTPRHSFVGITFINKLPRWWQIIRWIRLLQQLRAATLKKEGR